MLGAELGHLVGQAVEQSLWSAESVESRVSGEQSQWGAELVSSFESMESRVMQAIDTSTPMRRPTNPPKWHYDHDNKIVL